jgi:hypothetical protein
VSVQLKLVDEPTQLRILRALVADDEQLDVLPAAPADQRVRFDQPVDVLVRLDIARVQHER